MFTVRRNFWIHTLLAVSISLGGSTAMAQELAPLGNTVADEDPTPTPLSEFAPDAVRPARGERYDQALTVNRVQIEGNRLIPAEKIRNNMYIRPGSLYSKNGLKDDLRRIYDMGYFTEKIKAIPVATNDGIVLRIVVQENAPVTGVNIEGNTLIDDTELQSIFANQTGLPQNIGQLNESIEKVEKLYADKGYVLARVTGIEDDPDGVINLKINEGKLDQIQFVGNRKTKDFVLKRMMVTQEDRVYNEKVLGEDLKRIFGTQSFSDVRRVLTASPDNPDQYNLTIEVDEKRTGSISVGGGLDTSTGLFGSVGYNDPNFLGRGQSVNSVFAVGTGVIGRHRDTIAGARTYQFDVGWSDPAFLNSMHSLSVGAYGRDFASFNVPLGVERRIGSEISWGAPLMNSRNMSMGLSLRGENIKIRDYASARELRDFGISDKARQDMLKGGTFVSLSPTVAFDTRDNRFNPTTGWLNTVSLTGAYGLGGTSYGTASANLRKYIKIRDGITLALNAQGGQALMGDMPEFNMFRMGGAYSVRGFQEGGLGIGSGYLMSSAEVRTKLPFITEKLQKIPVLNSLSAAGFVDAGTLLKESSMNTLFDRPGMGASMGMGLRINMPGLGPIRIDYAVPFLGKGDYDQRWSFGIGEKF